METVYEDDCEKIKSSNRKKKHSAPAELQPARIPGRRRSATAITRNGSEIILEVPEDYDDKSAPFGDVFNECYDASGADDIRLGGEAISNDTPVGGLEIPPCYTPRGSLGAGPGSAFGSRCGSEVSHGSTGSAISWTTIQALRRSAAAAQAAVFNEFNIVDPTSIASLSRVGSGCFTPDTFSAIYLGKSVAKSCALYVVIIL